MHPVPQSQCGIWMQNKVCEQPPDHEVTLMLDRRPLSSLFTVIQLGLSLVGVMSTYELALTTPKVTLKCQQFRCTFWREGGVPRKTYSWYTHESVRNCETSTFPSSSPWSMSSLDSSAKVSLSLHAIIFKLSALLPPTILSFLSAPYSSLFLISQV